MITNKLFEMQRSLDKHIEETHQLQQVNLFEKKTLALLVELGELANETRCFKFWSLKAPSELSVILEEYVDGIHFILSLGIILGLEKEKYEVMDSNFNDLTTQFLRVNEGILNLLKTKSEDEYEIVFGLYLELGQMLGFTEEMIYDAYISKNEVNFLRQQQGY